MKTFLILLSIILLSIFLSFYRLSQTPPSVDWDEASSAYNAYSLLKTGRDEYGQKFPILFRAYDGYVPPVLIYLDEVSVFFFGLNSFSARFPNASLGVIGVFGIYLLVFKLSGKKKIAYLSALFYAICPWHLIYSRVGTFASLPITFIIFACFFLLIGLEKKRFLFLSQVMFILAILSYFSAYIFVPIFVCLLSILYRKKMKIWEIGFLVLPIVALFMLTFFVIPGGQNRFKGVSSVSDPDLIKMNIQESTGEGMVGKIIHNRRLAFAQKIFEGYFASTRLDFLFGKADAANRMVVNGQTFGLLYWWDLLFIVSGLYFLWNKKIKGRQIIFFWLLIAPLAASATLPQPVSTRVAIIAPALIIASAYGFWFFYKNHNTKILIGVSCLLILNFYIFSHQYFIHFSSEKSTEWFYGYQPLFTYLNTNEFQKRKVVFVFGQPDFFDQSHIFTAFYNRIDPKFYQSQKRTPGPFGTTGEFSMGRYLFIPNGCRKECGQNIKIEEQVLIVSTYKIPKIPYLHMIKSSDRLVTIYIYDSKSIPVASFVKFVKKVI